MAEEQGPQSGANQFSPVAEGEPHPARFPYMGIVPSGDTQSPPEEKPIQGNLPEDFPGRAALEAAEITTYAQLRKAGDVTAIDGIGPATKEKIDQALAAETNG